MNQLFPGKQQFLHPGSIKPRGWLRRQLQLQAEGLAGNLNRIWPDVKNSRWIGGSCEGWERVPYWLDGFIPLAWLLEDEDMQTRARFYVEHIIAHQQPDGWICPCTEEERPHYDVWGVFLICKVLAMYSDFTGDHKAREAVYRALKQLDKHLLGHTLFNWGLSRWFECLIPLFWLYESQPEDWMLRLADKLRLQGLDWRQVFSHWRHSEPRPHGEWSYITHVVNIAMALKAEALLARLDGTNAHEAAVNALQHLRDDHGTAAWHFTGDECLSGLSPIQGTELCGVVEAMYSYEHLIASTGDPFWSDMLERVAYNTLPATISPDMWTHQYDQLTNQIRCTPFEEGHVPFRTNSGESHLFGLEPNYGCCTANMGQGWPKLALSALMHRGEGLAIAAIAPVAAQVELCGVPVQVEIRTEYPFRNSYDVVVRTDKAVSFPLTVRIPGFASNAYIDGMPAENLTIQRTWQGETVLHVSFDTTPELLHRPGDMVCLADGPLLFALSPKATWTKVEFTRDGVERKFPYCDYHITTDEAWNFAFAGTNFVRQEHPLGVMPFSPDSPAVTMQVMMAPIPWQEQHGACTPQPESRIPLAPAREMTLIPYGCTTLRMTEMPLVENA